MSSSKINEGDTTVIRSRATGSQAEAPAPKNLLGGDLKVIGDDLGKVGKSALKSLGGFRTFILRGNVIDLAIGIVIGAAFTSVVTSLVKDIITPLIPVPGGNLSSASWNVLWTGGHFAYGSFINAIISFLLVAAVLYFFVVLPVNQLTKLYRPKEIEAHETRDCPYCFQAVHIHATRCPYCTSHLKEEEGKHEEEEQALVLPASLEKLSEKLAESIARKASTKLEQVATESSEGATAKE
ncbi:MAG TPA: large conductance mechanosensitive channel protein MscL [Ktedonobacteraceae bacterium]|nr:large conductance mechanosensitive channel protein MscL [Ktedonobacteraceae bacterium]